MQLSRTKFRKSFILSTKKWIKCFPGKNPVNSREKSGDITVVAADGGADLRANSRGTGFVVTDEDGHIILDLSAPVGAPVASLRSEAAGIFSILQKVEAHYNRHVQLMIFTDCLVLLLILSNWGHSDFWPDQGDVVHFDMSFPLIQKLRWWPKKVSLIKVKSHAGCFLNLATKWRTRVHRKVASPMLLQYSLCPNNMAHTNLALNLNSGLKWLEINFLSPVMKFRTNRFYDRLFRWTSSRLTST